MGLPLKTVIDAIDTLGVCLRSSKDPCFPKVVNTNFAFVYYWVIYSNTCVEASNCSIASNKSSFPVNFTGN